ncbi:eukaryotic translation initiation factor eIF2A-domain-containing protein [Peziza echinospora]|nr:eukaryotic translation initiation factor eIF2A-domain-containing protein [Peziza echinospora]
MASEYLDTENISDEEEIDFSDLREQYEVQLEEGLDAFVVVDGLPIVNEAAKTKLIKFLVKRLSTVGRTKADAIFMPMNEATGKSEGYAFVEYETPEQAIAATKKLNGLALDVNHTLLINKLTDIERFGREGRIDETYHAPHVEPFVEQEHLRSWLGDPQARDQMVLYRGDTVGVFWNKKKDAPEVVVDRNLWTESFVQWSPLGTFLTSMHQQGVQLWGGPSWQRIMRFNHPFVNLVDFSPDEKYLVTWSNKPITVVEGNPNLGPEEEGKQFLIWDVKTGTLIRSFASIDTAAPPPEEEKGDKAAPARKKIQWPVFKWASDSKYVARVRPGQSVDVYELPGMNLLDKKPIKIDGVVDFEWSPAVPTAEGGKKAQEHIFCYWTPEMDNQTARVGLMSVPSKEIIRTRNLFNVTDCRLHWQNEGKYLCVKVDRHAKTNKKTTFTNLEFFRVAEKNIPVEVVEIKEMVINFAWEPLGDRFVLITAGEVVQGAAVQTPKTAVSFYCPEKTKTGVGKFRLIRTIDKRNSNAIYWSPKGRFVVVATVHSSQGSDLEFYDFDFEGEKKETEKDLSANLQLVSTVQHYGVTDVDWDPTGRYVATSVSMWKHMMENGYHLWDFKGVQLREELIERFKQFLWRPRPPTLLSKEEQKNIRKKLREYSKIFDEEDLYEAESANKEVIDKRKRQLDEWLAWREKVEKQLREERKELGLSEDPRAEELAAQEGDTVIEEIREEVISEHEEEVL